MFDDIAFSAYGSGLRFTGAPARFVYYENKTKQVLKLLQLNSEIV